MEQFEIKVKFHKKQADESYKKVSETHLLANCESFTEAELLANKVIFKDAAGEKEINAITKRKYQYVLHDEKAEDWYKCTTALTTTNPDTEKETVVKNNYLVQADTVDHASERLQDFMGNTIEDMDDLDISGVTRVNMTSVIEDKVTEHEMEMEMDEEKVEEPTE